MVDSPHLTEGERVLWSGGPHTSVLGVWVFTKALPAIFMAAFLALWAFLFIGGMWATANGVEKDFNPFRGVGRALIVLVPVTLALSIVYIAALRRTYRYDISDQRVLFIGGLLVRRRRSVPYHKITDVEVSRNLLDQILGISTLKMYTAGSTSFRAWPLKDQAEISFPGLVDEQHAEGILNTTLSRFRATGE
jgi:uncharacterized membrane protein YdbT with pleckstrin-like domain